MSGNEVGRGAQVSYLARLLDVLECVATHDRGIALRTLAADAGIPMSTASRLTGLLVERGYAQRDPHGLLHPGARLLHLGLRTVAQLHDAPRFDAAVRAVAQATGESASAGLLVGSEIVLVARHEPDHPLRVVARVGDMVAPHTTAMGKAILAHLPRQRRWEVVAAQVGDDKAEAVLRDLDWELSEVKAGGFACDEETFAVGQRCRAVVLRDPAGQLVGGLSVAGPTARLTVEAADAATGQLRAQAARLAGGSGGTGEPEPPA